MNHLFIIIAGVAAIVFIPFWLKRRHVFEVPEGSAGMVYCHGLYVRRNNAGHRVIWGSGWTVKAVDLRKASLTVPVQELLTADNVSVKAGLLVTCQVIDPELALHETQNWLDDLFAGAQQALRASARGQTLEVWLKQRAELGGQLLAQVRPEAVKMGVEIHALEVRYLALPADLQQAFTDVLKARLESQAAQERARCRFDPALEPAEKY